MAIPFAFPSDEEIDSNYQRLDQLLVDLFDVLQQILVTQRRIRDAQPSHISQRVRYGPSSSSSNARRTGDEDATTNPPYNFQTPDLLRILATPLLESRVPGGGGGGGGPVDFLTTTTTTATTTVEGGGGALPSNADLLRLGASIDQGRSPSRRRRRRRRTSSESSSCCDEAKNNNHNVVLDHHHPIVAAAVTQQHATEDWTQVGANLRQYADDYYYASVGKDEPQSSEDSKRPCGVEANTSDAASLLSMLVPPAFGGSIWTAVIFVVGWRLLSRVR